MIKNFVLLVFFALWSLNANAEDNQLSLDRQLIKAVINEDVEVIKNLLKQGANPNNAQVPYENSTCKPQNELPAIHEAVLHPKSLPALIKNSKVNLNLLSDTHYCSGTSIVETPLITAMSPNREKSYIFKYLIDNGADVNFIYENNGTKRAALIILLDNLEYYSNLRDIILPLTDQKSILLALEYLTSAFPYNDSYMEELNLILDRVEVLKIVPNVATPKGSFLSKLFTICDPKIIHPIKRTISLGATPDNNGYAINSILSCTNDEMNVKKFQLIEKYNLGLIENIDKEAIIYLAKIGADLKSSFAKYFPNSSLAPYDLISYLAKFRTNNSYDISSTLFKLGVNPNNIINEEPFMTPLMWVRKNDEGFLRALIEAQANFDIQDIKGNSALNYFIDSIYDSYRIPSESMFKNMIYYSKNSINNYGQVYCDKNTKCKWTPLHQITATSNLNDSYAASMITYAIHCGANVNATDQFGRTPANWLDNDWISENRRIKLNEALKVLPDLSMCTMP